MATAKKTPTKGHRSPARSPSDSRTRARPPATVEERVAHIADLMRRLEWERGKSAVPLAAAWGISESTVRNYAAEAHRIVRAEVTDPDEVGRDIGVALNLVLRNGLKDLKGAPDVRSKARRDLTKAADVWATVSGAKAPDRHQFVDDDGASPRKAREVMRDLFGDVTPDAVSGGPEDDESAPEGPAAS